MLVVTSLSVLYVAISIITTHIAFTCVSLYSDLIKTKRGHIQGVYSQWVVHSQGVVYRQGGSLQSGGEVVYSQGLIHSLGSGWRVSVTDSTAS